MLRPINKQDALTERLETLRAQRRLPAPAVCREIRERVGLSRADVAAALGVPKAKTAVRYLALLDRLTQESMRA
jgi:DNA-binding transcriptional regulator YiaG